MQARILQLSGVSKHFGGLKAVKDVDLTVTRGEVVALVGPNGSGKTTLLNLISGALSPASGRIDFDGARLDNLPANRIAEAGIARTFQLVRVMQNMTVLDNVALAAMFGRHRRAPDDARDLARDILMRVRLDAPSDVPASRLTYIDQKRTELARALACAPAMLLLDEWLAGLNPTELNEGITLIREIAADGITIILVEHVMAAVRALATRCVVLNSGEKIADAPPLVALSDPKVVAAYLGEPDAAA